MENDRFDALTRALSAADSRRRTLHAFVILLLGGVLGGFATTLGTDEDAAAKAKKHKKGHKDHKQSGHVQAAGKHHKKHKHKNKHKDKDKDKPIPPLPPGCENCGTCQKCEDGTCVPDPDLDVIRCLDSPDDPGGQCHVCGNGECIPYRNGSVCNDGDECSWCQDGRCVPVPEKDLEPCGHTSCHLCDQGVCTPAGNGSECHDAQGRGVCCATACIHPTCDPDEEYDRRSCTCKPACADDEPPACGPCQEAICEDGAYVCRSACVAGTVCCKGTCAPICPPGKVVDNETCQCQPAVCPHGSPDVCSGTDPDEWQCGESESGFPCYCMRSTAGETHCSIPSWTYFPCVTDAECEQKYPGKNAFCNECNGTCYLNNDGCPGTDPA